MKGDLIISKPLNIKESNNYDIVSVISNNDYEINSSSGGNANVKKIPKTKNSSTNRKLSLVVNSYEDEERAEVVNKKTATTKRQDSL